MGGNNVITATSISPQIILSQQVTTTEGAIYTVPAATSVKLATASLCNVSSLITAPTLTLGTTSGSGGTFAAGTYYWKVTAKSITGETLASNEVTATLVLNGTQAFSWPAVSGAASYNLYRGTAPGAENVLVTNTASLTATDTGTVGTTQSPPNTSTFAIPVIAYLSLVANGGTIGDGTHRVLHAYSLAAGDSLSLKDLLGGVMLGPGDVIAGYASVGKALDLVVTGTVHA